MFESILYDFEVYENSSEVLYLGQVVATDKDPGRYGEVTYSLIGDSVHHNFRINARTGAYDIL